MKVPYTEDRLARIAGGAPIERPRQTLDKSGLVVFLRPSGGKTKIFFRARGTLNGKERVFPLGEWPGMTLARARLEYMRVMEAVARGEEPAPTEGVAPRVERPRRGPTLREAWESYLATKGPVAGSTVRTYAAIRKHLAPLMDRPLSEIGNAELLALARGLAGLPTSMQRVVSALRAAMDHASFIGMEGAHSLGAPYRYLPRTPGGHFHAYGDDTMADDLRAMFPRFAGAVDEEGRVCLALHFLTLLRGHEVRTITDGCVEWGDRVLAVKTKTRPLFRQPLTGIAADAVRWLQARPHGATLFSPRWAGDNMGLRRAFKRLGISDALHPHGIRALGRQFMETVPGAKESLIELCLSHEVGGQVQRAYNRGEYIEERRALLAKWQDYLVPLWGDLVGFL